MEVHVLIHGGCHEQRFAERQQGGAEKIVGDAGCQLGNAVCGGRCNYCGIGPLVEGNMLCVRLFSFGEQVAVERMVAEGLDGERGDKLQGMLRGDHLHLIARFYQQTYQRKRLVGGNAAGDAYQNVPFCHRCALLLVFLLLLPEIDFVVHEFLHSHQGRFGQHLIMADQIDLLLVLALLIATGVTVDAELLDFLVELLLHVHGNLVGAFCQDGHALIDVSGLLVKMGDVPGDGVGVGFDSLVIHAFLSLFM